MNKKFLILFSLSFLCLGYSTTFNYNISGNTKYSTRNILNENKPLIKQTKISDFTTFTTEPSYDYVTTPNGSEVPVQTNEELSNSTIIEYDSYIDELYPDAIRLRSASSLYNCHSYAWYSQSIANIYWMNNPSKYYEDLSYISTTSPQIGDIVCYFNDNGTSDINDDSNVHSGIIVGTNNNNPNSSLNNLNTYVVESKWGRYGLYRHRGDYCLYIDDGSVSYIKYFKRHSTHSFDYTYEWLDYTKHKAICECGEYEQTPHVVQAGSLTSPYSRCFLCGGLVRVGITHYSSRKLKTTKNGSYILPNGVIVLVDEDIELYFRGELVFE